MNLARIFNLGPTRQQVRLRRRMYSIGRDIIRSTGKARSAAETASNCGVFIRMLEILRFQAQMEVERNHGA